MPPNKWKMLPLAELTEEFVNGGTPKTDIAAYWSGSIPWITGADIKSFRVSEGRRRITREAIDESSTQMVPENTVLLVTRTSVGKVGVSANPLCFSQDITGIRCKPLIRPDYLARYLASIHDQLALRARGATIKGISRRDFEGIGIPVPPIEIQEKTTHLLDRLEQVTKKRKRANELMSEVVPSVFQKMFGDPETNSNNWKTATLGSTLMERLAHGFSLRRDKVREESVGIPVLKLSALTDDGLDPTEIKFYEESPVNVTAWLLRSDDILVSRSNTIELVGRVGRYLGDPADCIFPDLMIRVRGNPAEVEPAYLEYYLRSAFVRAFFRRRARGTSGSMPKISNQDILEVPVRLPHLDLQKRFSLLVLQVARLRQIQVRSTQEIQELFQSLVQEAFLGERV